MKKWYRIGLGLLVLALGLLLVGGFALYKATQHVPAFYEEALQADPARQHLASDKMVQHTAALVSDLRREGRWQAVFSEDEINGWLAVDLVQNYKDLLPGTISDPRVLIRPEGMTVGFRYREKGRQSVITLSVDAYLIEPNVVGLRIRKIRAGLLPLPLDDVLKEVARATNQLDWRVDWRQAGGDPVAQITIPPIRDQRNKIIQIETLRLGDKQLSLAGTTRRK